MAAATVCDEHAEALALVMSGIYRDNETQREVEAHELDLDYRPVYSRRQMSSGNCTFLCASHHREVK